MDTTKLKIILYRICMGVVIIWLLAAAIWEYGIDNKFEAIFLSLFALFFTWQAIKKWRRPDWGRLAFLVVWIGWLSFFNLRRDYNKHQNKLLLDKYGLVLNAKRAKLGIPVIPVNWQPQYLGDWGAEWRKKDSTIGHRSKLVFLDSLHRLKFEDDGYSLKHAGSVDRDVNITTYFSKSGSVDSTSYRYEAGMNNKTISRTQADSIFMVEKIQKDY
ncbi:hypothetical protein [Mucilaginibacter flavidus]|uniref:hypothetical protein n=1 Tax=Mucilaginibacter flavidus TaxID=2949309 RepID=UPI002092C3F3|nr:hypothetical protein [Mucilaginibacter flavidus]MCO5945922.1 hypothetical protein [Mucilaginibacter flavidus]